MLKLKAIVVLLMPLLALQAMAQDLFVKKSLFSQYEPVEMKKLQSIGEKNTVGEYPMLNVGEELRHLLSKVSYSTGTSVPLGRVVAFADRDKKHLVSVDMTANLQQANTSDWVDEPCKRTDFLWSRSTGGQFRDVNCVSINHVVNYFVNPTGEFQQILVLAKDDGVEIPPTIVRTTFTRYSSGGNRLVYIVDVNPEQYGIDRDATTPWGSNSWYKNFITRDPKKVEFIERLKKWATDVQDRMDIAFKKEQKAFSNIKVLDEYLKGKPQGDVKKIQPTQSAEERLKSVKNLFEKGLLTETQYNEQVKTILSNN